ncbi:MAG: Gfo/Idh/MocA family oxidoreductase [Planctomycetota bacterium]
MAITRRQFLAAASASAAALAAANVVHGGAEETIRVGLIGCGGRGTGAAQNVLEADGEVELVALADLFPERIESCLAYLRDPKTQLAGVKVDAGRCFTGFDGFEKLLALEEVDLVLLATPPGFRPGHFEAAIAAGKHVFLEKPVAVDPVGVRRVIAAGEKAAEKGLRVVAGTQRRHQDNYIEAISRIHDGAVGEIVAGRCSWNTGGLWSYDRKEGQSDVEWQVRNWLYFDWLSGDHIVEQHVHNLDVMNWVLRAHPLRATAVGGRTQRVAAKYGNIYDHFAVDYEYPGGIRVVSMCRQITGCADAVGESVVGTLGRANPAGAIEGLSTWRFHGNAPNPYVQEHRDLLAAIRDGRPLNEARTVAEATLTAILGREAAYTGSTIAWEEILASKLDLSPRVREFGTLAVRAIPVPGRER